MKSLSVVLVMKYKEFILDSGKRRGFLGLFVGVFHGEN